MATSHSSRLLRIVRPARLQRESEQQRLQPSDLRQRGARRFVVKHPSQRSQLQVPSGGRGVGQGQSFKPDTRKREKDAAHRVAGIEGFHVDHIPGSAEPLLWVADVVAGVVRASRQGSLVPLELLGERVHVLEVPTNC